MPPSLELPTFARQLEDWLATAPPALTAAAKPMPVFAERVEAMRALMAVLHAQGWSRAGWPADVGGLGGNVMHRAVLWEALERHGLPGMAVFEHLEVLGPALAQQGPRPLVAELFPAYLSGEQLWCQGFSEPDAGSDLASLRTSARARDGGYVINGRKLWTTWARYARWCLLLARTGPPESRHRGLTAFIVDLLAPGVEVRPIVQANGTDELGELSFDDVEVDAGAVVGEVGGGWAMAMHILAHERGTFAWFRHCGFYRQLVSALDETDERHDVALGTALIDLATVTAAGRAVLDVHAGGATLGPRAAFTKLLLCIAEQSASDWLLAAQPALAVAPHDDETALRRQEYLFSRIITIYGGSQQMQLETIAKQVLHL